MFCFRCFQNDKTLANAKTNGGKGRKVKIQMLFCSNLERIIDKAVENEQHFLPISREKSDPTYTFKNSKDTMNFCMLLFFE